MIDTLNKARQKLGVDKAIVYTVLARVIQAGGGVLSIFFTARYLSKVEQGYYYTFGSILAIQVFFELGLSSIITQFVAHEMAHLSWKGYSELSGNRETLSRLSSLLRFCIRWFLIVSVGLILLLIVVGYIFFSTYHSDEVINWKGPWAILALSTGCNLVASPILAFFEGLGKVSDVARVRLMQQTSQLILLFIFLACGLSLFASPLASILAFFVIPSWLIFSYRRKLLQFIWKQLDSWHVNYKSEIFPYQWRIALSWMSSYFIFQLFNPVLFATEGAVVAGQMGMTLAALNGIIALPMSWLSTKIPLFSSLIARLEYQELDDIFNRTVKQAGALCLACILLFFVLLTGLQEFYPKFRGRFLPFLPTLLLCAAIFANQFVGAFATYLRCHKKEPFLILSVVMGVCCALSTLLLGKFYGILGITTGYCFLVIFVSLPAAYRIYVNKKKLWH